MSAFGEQIKGQKPLPDSEETKKPKNGKERFEKRYEDFGILDGQMAASTNAKKIKDKKDTVKTEYKPLAPKKEAPVVVGGSLNKEGELAKEEEPSQIIVPLAEIQNHLTGVKLETLTDTETIRSALMQNAINHGSTPEEAAELYENITTIELPKLQAAFEYWTNSSEIAEQITLETITGALAAVESGEESLRRFIVSVSKKIDQTKLHQPITPGQLATAILEDESIRQKVESLWQKLLTYDAAAKPSREYHAESDALFEHIKTKLADEKTLFIDDDIPWGDGEQPDFENVMVARNRAEGSGKSLHATIVYLLNKLEVTDPVTNKPTSAYKLVQENVSESGKNTRFVISGTGLVTELELAQRHFDKLRDDNIFIIDRSVGRIDEVTGEKTYNSIGQPISRILFALHEARAAETDAELETSPLRAVIAENHTEFATELFEALQQATGRSIEPDKIKELADQLTTKLFSDTEIVEDSYQEALESAQKDSDTLGGNEVQLDDFAQLQQHFTKILFEKTDLEEALSDLTDGNHASLQFAGVYRDPEVDGRLRSESYDTDLGTKRNRIEVFVNSLRQYFEISKGMCPDCTNREREELALTAKAIYFVVTELRAKRLEVLNKNASDTAELLSNYASVFKTLVNRNILEPLPGQIPPPLQQEDEAEEDFLRRSRRYYQSRKDKAKHRRQKFREEQTGHVIDDLQKINTALENKESLNNFLGTLGRILNIRGKKLKDRVRQKRQDILDNPENYHETTDQIKAGDEPSWVTHGASQELIQELESLDTKLDGLEIALDASQKELTVAIHRTEQQRSINDPKSLNELQTATEHWQNVHKTTVDETFANIERQMEASNIANGTESDRLAASDIVKKYNQLNERNTRILNDFKKLQEQLGKKETGNDSGDNNNEAVKKYEETIEELKQETTRWIEANDSVYESFPLIQQALQSEDKDKRQAVAEYLSQLIDQHKDQTN